MGFWIACARSWWRSDRCSLTSGSPPDGTQPGSLPQAQVQARAQDNHVGASGRRSVLLAKRQVQSQLLYRLLLCPRQQASSHNDGAGDAERDLCRPSAGVAQGETSHGWRVSAVGPGTAHRRGPPERRRSEGTPPAGGAKPEQWFFPPFCRNKKGVAVKAKPVAAVMQHPDLHPVLYALLLAQAPA